MLELYAGEELSSVAIHDRDAVLLGYHDDAAVYARIVRTAYFTQSWFFIIIGQGIQRESPGDVTILLMPITRLFSRISTSEC